MSQIKKAKEAGLEEIAKEFAGIVYNAGRGASYDERLFAAEILGKSEKEKLETKKDRLLEVMSRLSSDRDNNFRDYAQDIRANGDGIQSEDIKIITMRACSKLMNDQTGSRITMHFQAAYLAKTYLGERGFIDVGRKLIEKISKNIDMWDIHRDDEYEVDFYHDYYKKLRVLEFPDEMVRPLMLRIFKGHLSNPEEAKEIEL